MHRYVAECAEWQEIAADMIAKGQSPSAYDVSEEQRSRMAARGENPMTYEEIIQSFEAKPS